MDATMDGKKRLIDGNAMFRKSIDPGLLARLSKKQEPFVAILTCSDSRVSPVKIFNLSLGEAFVVRVAGNSASDQSALGSLEYAVDHLHVKYLLVLGHTGCGAVRAMVEGEFLPNLRPVMKDLERARFKTPTEQINDENRLPSDDFNKVGRAEIAGELGQAHDKTVLETLDQNKALANHESWNPGSESVITRINSHPQNPQGKRAEQKPTG